MGSTTVSLDRVEQLAIEIFDEVFARGYFWASFNCQAFVCTLIYLLRVEEGDVCRYDLALETKYKKKIGHITVVVYLSLMARSAR